MMDKSLPAFRRFLTKNVIELEGNLANAIHQQGSSSKRYVIGHWLYDDDSDDDCGDADNEDGIARGKWLYDDSERAEDVGAKENEVKEAYARLELVFPQLTMLITKGIADNWTIDQPSLHTHISLYKPVTASHLIFASVNAAYCRDTTFCGAVIHEAANPANFQPVLQEQITQLSFFSNGEIVSAPASAQKPLHRRLESNLDLATNMEPNFTLSLDYFQLDDRSYALYETTRNFFDVVSVCPISAVRRLKLEIQGLDVDDMDDLTDLVSSRTHSTSSRAPMLIARPRYHACRSIISIWSFPFCPPTLTRSTI
jgi:hypothetical protein